MMDALGFLLLLSISPDDARVGAMVDYSIDGANHLGASVAYLHEPAQGAQALLHIAGRDGRIIGELSGGVALVEGPLPGYDRATRYGILAAAVGIQVQDWDFLAEATHYSTAQLFREGHNRDNHGYNTFTIGIRWRP